MASGPADTRAPAAWIVIYAMIDTDDLEIGYPESIVSCKRTIYSATPENRPRVFVMMARDARTEAKANYFDEQTLNDWLMDAAYGSGLVEEVGLDHVQLLLAESTKPAPSPALDISEFLALKIPPRQNMLAPWLPVQGLAMIHAPRGIGKTHVALGASWAISVGKGFLRWVAPQPRRVLILDGEMPATVLQERFNRIAAASQYYPEPGYLKILAADIQPDGLPDLSEPGVQAQYYAPFIAAADLVVVDNLSTLCRTLKENDADSWQPVQSWALSIRRMGKSVLLIHHGGKSGAQRGTSRKEDVLDTVMSLRKPPDYSADQGARFEIHFEKARGFHGPEAEPFEARLIGEQWSEAEIRSGDDDETLRALHKSGLSVREISDRTGVPRSTVHRRLQDCPTGQTLGASRGTVPEHRTNGSFRTSGTSGTHGTATNAQ
jgi:hypothetical protein